MWKLKSCPKCSGDLFVDRDIYGWFQECIQCGYLKELETLDIKEQRPERSAQQRKILAAA